MATAAIVAGFVAVAVAAVVYGTAAAVGLHVVDVVD